MVLIPKIKNIDLWKFAQTICLSSFIICINKLVLLVYCRVDQTFPKTYFNIYFNVVVMIENNKIITIQVPLEIWIYI
jgi:hypothetical protein